MADEKKAEKKDEKKDEKASAPLAETTPGQSVPTVNLLAGFDNSRMRDGKPHVGIAIRVKSTIPSVLMIPDATGVAEGKSPVFITKPVVLELRKLQTFLQNKQVSLPEPVTNLLNDANLECNAFYFRNNGPMLMMFSLTFNTGAIQALLGTDIGDLFDIQGVAARVFRSTEGDIEELRNYAADLAR